MIDTKPEKLPVFRKGKYIFAGVTKYKTLGSFLLRKETLDKMASSFRGCPVNIMHDGIKCGTVIGDPEFNPSDNWFYVPFMVETQEGLDAMNKPDFSLSCTWEVLAYGSEAGTFAGVPYDKEIVDARYTELAITPNPHYEDADIFRNSDGSVDMDKTKNALAEGTSDEVVAENIKKMVEAGVPQEQAVAVAYEKAGRSNKDKNSDEEPKSVPLSRIFYKGASGDRISAADLVSAWESEKDAEYDEEEWGDDDPLELEDGTLVTMKELAEAYNRKNKKGDEMQNSEDKKPEDKPSDDKKGDEVKNGAGCLKNGEPEAAEHTALIAEALALLESGKVDEAKAKLGSVAKKEAAEIKNGDDGKDGKDGKDEEKPKGDEKPKDEEKPALKTDKIANSDLANARRSSATDEPKEEDLRTKKYETGFGAASRLGY